MGREALESSSPGFQPSAKPSQLPTQISCCVLPATVRPTKKAQCRCDTGLWQPADLKAKRHKRSGSAGELPSSDRHRIASNAYRRLANSELTRCAERLPAIRSWIGLGRKKNIEGITRIGVSTEAGRDRRGVEPSKHLDAGEVPPVHDKCGFFSASAENHRSSRVPGTVGRNSRTPL